MANQNSRQTAFRYPGLAGFFECRDMALELVRGADFSWELMCGAGPGDLGGSRGSGSAENPGKTESKISSQTAFAWLHIGRELQIF